MLRLLFIDLMDTLCDAAAAAQSGGKQQQVDGVSIHTFHGTDLTLRGDEFWIHLNYQLIHLLDFLPTQHYAKFVAGGDAFTRLFLRLHEYLRNHDKLMANVRVDRLGMSATGAETQGLPTWDFLLSKVDKAGNHVVAQAHAQLGAQVRQYSKAINHNRAYEIHCK